MTVSAPVPGNHAFDSDLFVVAPEVRQALEDGTAVVALESTIISHGLPRPENLRVAAEVEDIVRSRGATPATIAILDGKVLIGLDDSALDLFYRLLQPGTRVDGTARPACITTIGDVVQLCDVLAEPAARAVLMEPGATLGEAVEVINAGVFQQWTAQVGEVVETMKWDRRRFGPRS